MNASPLPSLLGLLAVLAIAAVACAQPTDEDSLGIVHSLGRPPVWKPFTGAYYGLDRSGNDNRSGGGAYLGLYKDLLPSIVGMGLSGEGYAAGYPGESGFDGGVRLLAEARSLMLKLGVDYDIARDDTSFLLSLTPAIRRGGVLGHGTAFRIDWLPGRGQSWNFGVQIPLEPHMGKTRPRSTEVALPRGKEPKPAPALSPAAAAAMQEVRGSARTIATLTSRFWNDERSDREQSLEKSRAEMRDYKTWLGERDGMRPQGKRLENEVRILHDQLDLAFGFATGASDQEARAAGAPLAALAREVMLDQVLFPYNRRFGQYKHPEDLWGLAAAARERFAAGLGEVTGDSAHSEGARLVFEDYLKAIDELRAWGLERHEADSRIVWLPLQLALRDDQHDTQAELDAIISRAQDTPFTSGNSVFYWNGQEWQLTLHRSIHAARDYHVLWLHDYDGVDGAGNPDGIGYYITVEGYLKALTERVREFDQTGKLPTFMILVDLCYWEMNQGRLYTDVLQDPLHVDPHLPLQEVEKNQEFQAGTEQALAELRAAVAGSQRLQAEAARRGQDWLRDYVSVHLSVMNPADFSFKSGRLVDHLPFAPDTAMRDHRKIIFFDLTELDPGKGAALFGGVGVGEQYASATWEDRAVSLRGPAALTLKDAARGYLKQNGFADEDIPLPLRPLPKPADYDQQVRALAARGWNATAMEVHNAVGFAEKDASVVSALLYTLMPSGSLIIVPDSIWTHELWAGQLFGAVMRGCHVYVIAPAAANAPSAGFPQLARTREVWSRFIEARTILASEISERGGDLRVGLYTRKGGVNDAESKLDEISQAFERYPFLKKDFPFPKEFYARVGKAADFLAATGYEPPAESLPEDAKVRAPKMHRKTQLFITRDALAAIVRDPQTQDAIADLTRFFVEQGIVFDATELAHARVDFAAMVRPLLEVVHDLNPALRDTTVMYMTVGSLNKDARGMMTDGEVLQVTSGPWAMWAVADMWFLTGSTTWIESQEELDRLLPPYTERQRRIGRWLRKVI